jgi:sialic acid synthase SpsE
MIEKHLTLDRSLSGPDHVASIEPGDFKAMVSGIRLVERALGDGRKMPMPSELKTMPIARKSLVARGPIKRGERFGTDTLTVKRPGTGVSPVLYWEYIGRTATRDYQAEDVISETT